MLRAIVASLTFLVSFLPWSTALAQWGNGGSSWTNPYTGTTWNNPMSSYLDTVIMNGIWSRFPSSSAEAEPTESEPLPPVGASAFVPRADRLQVQAVAAGLTDDPQLRAGLADLFEAGLQQFEAVAREDGREHNVALAFTYLVGVSYLVYTGGEEPSERALEAVWEAVHRTLAGSQDFQRSSHAERQGFYETLVMLATLPLAGYQEGRETGDAETLATYRALAGELLSTLFDAAPDEVRFTADGLIVGR
jgi:hypothetical protein